jgi:probable rRNA maturation factor
MLRPPLRELSLALVGDRRMSELHVQFMDVAGPTDVLTFPLDADARGRVTAGEVVVCVPEARRRARREGTDWRAEALLYALHGLLHLCGHDDRTDRAYRRMHKTEDEILTRLGVGPVFAPAAPPTTARTTPPKRTHRAAPAASAAAPPAVASRPRARGSKRPGRAAAAAARAARGAG